MKIISPFKDYYDSVQSWGADSSLTYLRKTEVSVHTIQESEQAVFSKQWEYLKELPSCKTDLFRFNPALVCFCGKAYPYLVNNVTVDDYYQLHRAPSGKSELEWATENVKSYESLFGVTSDTQKYSYGFIHGSEKLRKLLRAKQTPKSIDIGYASFHYLSTPVYLIAADMFLNTSYFYWDQRRRVGPQKVLIVKNPPLCNFEFFKQIDSFSAYQEIEMFLGSVLAVEDKSPQRVGGDAIAIRNHGFDEQSFRTVAPGQKKLNRKANKLKKHRKIGNET